MPLIKHFLRRRRRIGYHLQRRAMIVIRLPVARNLPREFSIVVQRRPPQHRRIGHHARANLRHFILMAASASDLRRHQIARIDKANVIRRFMQRPRPRNFRIAAARQLRIHRIMSPEFRMRRLHMRSLLQHHEILVRPLDIPRHIHFRIATMTFHAGDADILLAVGVIMHRVLIRRHSRCGTPCLRRLLRRSPSVHRAWRASSHSTAPPPTNNPAALASISSVISRRLFLLGLARGVRDSRRHSSKAQASPSAPCAGLP